MYDTGSHQVRIASTMDDAVGKILLHQRYYTMRAGRDCSWYKQQILELRLKRPGLGKDKLKTLLDKRCCQAGQPALSVSTIGRLVTKLQVRGELPTRRQLTLSAIDYRSQFAFSYGYKTLSSASATDFLVKLRQVAPFDVIRVQTDNGAEFHKHFHAAIEQLTITHFWSYPRSPKMNAKIERYNRTVQEEFVDWYQPELTEDLADCNSQLMDWLIWYNAERPHWSLRLTAPWNTC